MCELTNPRRPFSPCRAQDHHQRPVEQHQAVGGGDDTHRVLPNGVRPLRPPGVHGCTQEQVCSGHAREFHQRGVEKVSTRPQ